MLGLKVYPAIPSFVTIWNILWDIFHTYSLWNLKKTVKTSLRNNTFKYNFNRSNQVLGNSWGKRRWRKRKLKYLVIKKDWWQDFPKDNAGTQGNSRLVLSRSVSLECGCVCDSFSFKWAVTKEKMWPHEMRMRTNGTLAGKEWERGNLRWERRQNCHSYRKHEWNHCI